MDEYTRFKLIPELQFEAYVDMVYILNLLLLYKTIEAISYIVPSKSNFFMK